MGNKVRVKPMHKGMRADKRAKMFKEYQAKTVTTVDEDKSVLMNLVGKRVMFSGEVSYVSDRVPTMMVNNVSVNKLYLEHLWITLSGDMRSKLRMAVTRENNRKAGVRIYFVGTVRPYTSKTNEGKKTIIKYGIYNVRLVTKDD